MNFQNIVNFLFIIKVVATEENREPPSEQVPARREDGLNTDLASHISSVAFKLALTADEHNVCPYEIYSGSSPRSYISILLLYTRYLQSTGEFGVPSEYPYVHFELSKPMRF